MEALFVDFADGLSKLSRKFKALHEAFNAQRDDAPKPRQSFQALAAGGNAQGQERHVASEQGRYQ